MISQLPKKLREAIETITPEAKELIKARIDLTERYRQTPAKGPYMTTEQHRLAYLSARMPATYGAVSAALKNLPNLHFSTLLDIGAGPGTAIWAACEAFPSIEKAIAIEKDEHLAAWGKKLALHAEQAAIRSVQWDIKDFVQATFTGCDLVTFSYSIGEISKDLILPLVDKAWEAAGQALVIIEPGTPAGFERIRLIRQHLIDKGAPLAAPCPHTYACPMPMDDWCHFSVRVERDAFHRRLKEASLPYEDEKYSYVAAVKIPCPLPAARILRPPMHRSGHSVFTLCTADGIKQETVSKRQENYKSARKLEWGDVI